METLKMRIPKHFHFRGLVDCQVHLTNTQELIVNKVTESQMRMFRAHPLGRLMDSEFNFFGPLVLLMLLRQIEQPDAREAQLFIGDQAMSFTYADFMRINGLSKPEAGLVMLDPSSRLMPLFLNGEHGLTKNQLENKFEECRAVEHTDDDMVKLALVVFIELVLLKERTVDYSHFEILDDLSTTAKFPWGKVIWRKLLDGINLAISKQKLERVQKKRLKGDDSTKNKKSNEMGPCLFGFACAFQVWPL